MLSLLESRWLMRAMNEKTKVLAIGWDRADLNLMHACKALDAGFRGK